MKLVLIEKPSMIIHGSRQRMDSNRHDDHYKDNEKDQSTVLSPSAIEDEASAVIEVAGEVMAFLVETRALGPLLTSPVPPGTLKDPERIEIPNAVGRILFILYSIVPHHIKSHHIASHHIISHHITPHPILPFHHHHVT